MRVTTMFQPTQRAPHRGIKGTNRTPKYTASLSYRNCGIAYTGDGAKSPHLQGDGASILLKVGLQWVPQPAKRLDRHGYKGRVTTPESPAVWEEGRQLLSRQCL
jgi:hypothetical protein